MKSKILVDVKEDGVKGVDMENVEELLASCTEEHNTEEPRKTLDSKL
jgi:hypothetical protein